MKTLYRAALYRVALLAAIAVVFTAVGYGAVHIARDATIDRQQDQRPIPATLLPEYQLHMRMMYAVPPGLSTHSEPPPGKNVRQ
jgi:hypothetical protein